MAPTQRDDPKSPAEAPPDMSEADAANGEPDALKGTTTATPRTGKPPVGEEQAAENRENDPPG